ncbi:hypothetical protein [Bacillus gaemokensis]|uniref:hypothetical protein n=1 Tax=Bacillus gaemokensis TaxID=574375 RepID=UPI000798FE80|nr:hypothetical protein [Bacillus gaemokensis]KYG37264.1 hypothetical protein AZF08_07610 [Bacillus gaemokensis]
MKDYLIRAFFASLTVGISLVIANIFDLNVDVRSYPFLIIIAIVGGWSGWYLYQRVKNNNYKGISK